MKILVLAPKIIPHTTGTPIRIFEVCRRLGTKNEVFVLSLGPRGGIFRESTFRSKVIPYGKLAHLRFLLNIIKYARRYDVIYSHTYLPNLLGILCKFLHRKKSFVMCTASFFHKSGSGTLSNNIS